MRKFTKLLVAAAFLLTSITSPLAASANGSSFADLKRADAWAQAGIVKAKELGLVSGDPNGNFNPLSKVTRQEAASILARLLKLDTTGYKSSSFSDVPSGLWGLGSIEAVKKAGVMIGEGGKFRPNAALTREELAVILVKAAGIDATGQGSTVKFADKASISPWALDAVGAAFEQGLMVGADNKFSPQATTTRQELAVVAVNFSQALLSTVQNVTESSVTINGTSYQLGDAVKGLFAVKNKAILTGAKIKFRAEGTTLTEVNALEITASGQPAAEGAAEFSGNLVLDGAGAAVKGSLEVGGNYITLQNLTIEGDLIISEKLQNDFYSNGLTVKGKTVVNGGDTNTVVFHNATLGAVDVNKRNVRLEATGKSTLGELTVTTDATIQADNGVTIPKLTVGTGAKNVEIDAPVGTLNVLNSTAKLDVKKPINKVVLPDGAKIADLVKNYEKIKDLLKEIFIGNKPVDPTPTTPGNSNSTPPAPLPVTVIPSEVPGTVNFAEGADIVEGIAKPGTTIKVYDAATGGTVLGSTVTPSRVPSAIPSDHVIFQVHLTNGFPSGSNKAYVTYTEPGKRESARQAISYVNVPDAPTAEQIEVQNGEEQDQLVIQNVPAHTKVEVFRSTEDLLNATIGLATNDSAETADLVVPIPDGLDDLAEVHVAYVIQNDELRSKAISSLVTKSVPGAVVSDAPTAEDIYVMNYAAIADSVVVQAPLGSLVTLYDADGAKITSGYAQSVEDSPAFVVLTVENGVSLEGAQVSIKEPNKVTSAKTPVTVEANPAAPQASDIKIYEFDGYSQIVVNNVPGGQKVVVYDAATASQPLYTSGVNVNDVPGPQTITVNEPFPVAVTQFHIAFQTAHAESARVAVAVEDNTPATPEPTSIYLSNYTNAADVVSAAAPAGTTIRVYKLENGEYTKIGQGVSVAVDYDLDGVPNYESARVEIEGGFGDLTKVYVTAQTDGQEESAKVEASVPVVAPELTPDVRDLTATLSFGLYQLQAQNVPGLTEVFVYSSADAVEILSANSQPAGSTETVTVNFNLPAHLDTVYVSYFINGAETALVPVEVKVDVAKAVSLENHFTGADKILVSGPQGYTVRIYDAATGGSQLKEVVIGEYGFEQIVLEDGFDGMSTVYVTITGNGHAEGARTALEVPMAPNAPLAENIHVNHYLNDLIEVVVDDVPDGAYVTIKGADGSQLTGGASNMSGATGSVTIPVYGLPTTQDTELFVSFYVRNEAGHGAESPIVTVNIPEGTAGLSAATLAVNEQIDAGDATELIQALQNVRFMPVQEDYANQYQAILSYAKEYKGAGLNYEEIADLLWKVFVSPDKIEAMLEINTAIDAGDADETYAALEANEITGLIAENAALYQSSFVQAKQNAAVFLLSLPTIQAFVLDMNELPVMEELHDLIAQGTATEVFEKLTELGFTDLNSELADLYVQQLLDQQTALDGIMMRTKIQQIIHSANSAAEAADTPAGDPGGTIGT
ncbi:S-layer family protein [Tumebacillus sp. BK434]|uniref:S-layer homology domain-containing protein n=1 Tax=Tumebacillus sp. BK434 TaxID=2512169 RepID=UPI0010EC6C95|nr:S-layer homology domain-containing protein [Tumebacillus sp. BK434]TCP58184.1 S-layer family protein [Tumebacillus sp. BK434]